MHSVTSSGSGNITIETVFSLPTPADELVAQAIPQTGWLADYVAWAAPCTEAPVLYHLGAGLACLATAVGRRAYCHVAGPDPLYGNLYVALIGAQGICRKSTVLRFAESIMAPAFHAEFYSGDATPEALSRNVLGTQSERLLLYDELSALLGGPDYRSGLPRLLATLYNCPAAMSFDRIGLKGTEPVERPTVSVLGASTLAWLRSAVQEDDIGGGIFSRFCWFVSDASGEIMPRPKRSDSECQADLSRRLAELRSGLGDGRELDFSIAADDHDALYRRFMEPAINESDGETRGGSLSRLGSETAPKLALLYTLAGNPQATSISPDVYAHVEALCDLLRGGMERLFNDLEGDKTAQTVAKVASFIAKHGADGVDKRTMLRNMRPRLLERDLMPVLATLQSAGEVELVDGHYRTTGDGAV